MLDGNIDDGLSDARSLAASMRGGGGGEEEAEKVAESRETETEQQAARFLEFNRIGSIRRRSVLTQVYYREKNVGYFF